MSCEGKRDLRFFYTYKFLSFFFVIEGCCSDFFFGFLSIGYYKFNVAPGTSGEEVTQLLDATKACSSNANATWFLQIWVFVLFRVIFVGLVFVAWLLWMFSFLPRCCNTHASDDKARDVNFSRDLFFLQTENFRLIDYRLSAYFCRLSSAEGTFFWKLGFSLVF